ncbi:helix-turn-helix domain-containing protein [Celerinatantimonas diazotrophica]|uniref:Zn-dependent peptidase ImmA (M78 family) n=1 Tax=Celerinatantimonas diazotrophica TaxID=412034 RepID=A0A4R1JLS0_9GAMM|nr:XRE family transcriptional regulator [Celerinatantimonas diazotrophica]TCK51986.1 Zn-dependent peptidase ImmA (M78 family) [Celerinatantimonas diazotrophica]CAG9296313.1 hypothetical protein CEDIAZO_01461 [Celerinatantimonas diazotrophica]
MFEQFNPARLRLARLRRQYTLKLLAEKVGLSTKMVSEYEKEPCRYNPPEETLSAFAVALNYPKEFFMDTDNLEPVDRDTVSFRALKRMKASQMHAAVAAGEIGVLINNFFDNKFSLPKTNVPDYRGIEPSSAASAIRSEWDLGHRSISNMIHLLEKNGVRVFSLSENTQDVDAFSFWKDNVPYVFLNTQKSGERSRFDAAHELGHLLLHAHGVPQGKDIEAEADSFAANLLMPKETVLPYKNKLINLSSVLKLKHNWKVSAMALIVQMKNVGVLSEWQYKTLIIDAGKMGLRTREIDGIDRERSLVIEKILLSLREDGISMSKLAQLLHIPLDELSGLLFSIGLVNSGNTDMNQAKTANTRPYLRLVK